MTLSPIMLKYMTFNPVLNKSALTVNLLNLSILNAYRQVTAVQLRQRLEGSVGSSCCSQRFVLLTDTELGL